MSEIYTPDEELAKELADEEEDFVAADGGTYRMKLAGYVLTDVGGIIRKDKNKLPFVMPYFEIIEHPDAENFERITHYVGLPCKMDDKRAAKRRRIDYKRFCKALDIDPAGEVDWRGLIGTTVEAIISEPKINDPK